MTPFTDRLMTLPRYALDGASAIHPGFERIRALLAGMNHPERKISIALVAGTNGKGSTASIMAACLTAEGIKTGLHTSPHLIHVSERMRVDGKTPSTDWLEEQCERFEELFIECGASFFEATLALSLLWFAHQQATHAVVEVGLGGRLDATNVLDADVCIITGVALDHTDLLGETIAEIAVEKAGIIKRGKPVILGAMPEEAVVAISNVAGHLRAPLVLSHEEVTISGRGKGVVRIDMESRCLDNVTLYLSGAHQWSNSAAALTALDSWMPHVSSEALRIGLENVSDLTGLRARTEVVHNAPIVMIDVGHNADAIGNALTTFYERVQGESLQGESMQDEGMQGERAPGDTVQGNSAIRDTACIIVGLLSDKDAVEIGRVLSKTGLPVHTVPIHGVRGRTELALSDTLSRAGVASVQAFPDVRSALDRAIQSNSNCLVLGSHMVAADALAYFSNRSTE